MGDYSEGLGAGEGSRRRETENRRRAGDTGEMEAPPWREKGNVAELEIPEGDADTFFRTGESSKDLRG